MNRELITRFSAITPHLWSKSLGGHLTVYVMLWTFLSLSLNKNWTCGGVVWPVSKSQPTLLCIIKVSLAAVVDCPFFFKKRPKKKWKPLSTPFFHLFLQNSMNFDEIRTHCWFMVEGVDTLVVCIFIPAAPLCKRPTWILPLCEKDESIRCTQVIYTMHTELVELSQFSKPSPVSVFILGRTLQKHFCNLKLPLSIFLRVFIYEK